MKLLLKKNNKKREVKMVRSARIVLVLKFHCTLAAPGTFTLTFVSPPSQPKSAHKLRCLKHAMASRIHWRQNVLCVFVEKYIFLYIL